MRPLLPAVLTALALPALSSAALVDLTWNGTAGNWSDPSRWTPSTGFYPQNNVTDQFNATVTSGSLTLTEDITVNSASISNVTLSGNGFSLGSISGITLGGTINRTTDTLILAGPLSLAGSTTITSSTSSTPSPTTSLNGPMSLGANTLTLANSVGRTTVLLNTNTLTINGNGSLNLANPSASTTNASFTNQASGLVRIVGDVSGSVAASGAFPAKALFTNLGTLLKTGSSVGHETAISAPFINQGSLQVQSGILTLNAVGGVGAAATQLRGSINLGSGTTLNASSAVTGVLDANLNIGSGATFRILGPFEVGSSLAVTGSGLLALNGGTISTVGNYTLNSEQPLTVIAGAISGPSAASTFTVPSGLLLNGTLNRTGTGAMTLAGPITVGPSATINGSSNTTVLDSSITLASNALNFTSGSSVSVLGNAGTLTINGAAGLNLVANSGSTVAHFVNQVGGLWEVVGDVSGGVTRSGLFGTNLASSQVTNAGTFRKSGSVSNHVTTVDAAFANTGTVEAKSGRLSFVSFPTNSGVIDLTDSQVFVTSSLDSVAGSHIQGTGTLTTGGLTINGGTVSPGHSVGVLNFSGPVTFTNAGGTDPVVNLELNGTGLAFYDQITLTSNHTLALGAGVTDLNLDLNFNPLLGTTFRILSASATSGQITGSFRDLPQGATFNVLNHIGDTYTLQINYDTKFVDLTVMAVPEPSTWAALAGVTAMALALLKKRKKA